jgi:hypothetical protein
MTIAQVSNMLRTWAASAYKEEAHLAARLRPWARFVVWLVGRCHPARRALAAHYQRLALAEAYNRVKVDVVWEKLQDEKTDPFVSFVTPGT